MFDYILFIDSGLGGLSTLASTMKIRNANYLYFADNLYSPYGNKSDLFLKYRLTSIIKDLIKKYNIKIIVLACNTATTTSINFLRNTFKNITFVGTEPATKLAHDKSYSSSALIATPQTIKHLKQPISSHINTIPCPTLASLIEKLYLNFSYSAKFSLLKLLYSIKIKTQGNDCIILGCTHYSLIKNLLAKITNKCLLDGNKGVSQRITSITPIFQEPSSYKIILSEKNIKLLQKYKKILKQILANQINLC